jgi:adenosylhomocysteine nucleosidase
MRLLLLICLLLTAQLRADNSTGVDLLIVATDDDTLAPILHQLSNRTTETHGAWTIWNGALAGKRVAITRTEGDPLNAVAATTLAIRFHPPRLIFVISCGRPHDPTLRSGDVVVSESFAAFDGMISPPTKLGEGSHALRWEKLPHELMRVGEIETPTEAFAADPHARSLALTLNSAKQHVIAGVLGSASQINREADRIAYLRSQWHTSTEDGDSAHVAGCATLFSTPVIGACVVNGTAEAAADFALQFVAIWK